MTRLQIYVASSAFLANVVLLRAYYERPNFYSAAVYISQSTGSLMFLINLSLIVTASIGYGLQRLFYGPLRPIETEQLYDKAWFAVSETLLAMTIFRDDIGIWFFAMFLCLLAGKVWQWIGEGRVEFLEQQPPANPRLFHTRLASSLIVSVAFDVFMTQYCVDSILRDTRPGVMVMFGFEYVLLAIASTSTLLRYALSLVELAITHRQEKARAEARQLAREQARQRAQAEATAGETVPASGEEEDDDDGDVPGWEEKGRWVFYLDLATDFIKSVVYLGFFMILMAFYGIPIHIMRDLFMTIRSFIKRINDFVQYRNATRDMNARYPDATEEELARENTCIVCREEMRPWVQPGADGAQAGRRIDERQRAKKLPCGHILHFSCLRSWLERQQVCPTCRRPVLAEATPANNRQNNQQNPGQQNQQNQLGGLRFRGLVPPAAQGAPQGQNGVQQVQPGQHGQVGQQQPLPQGQQGGNQNAPVGNVRVLRFGPIRIALGNLRIPEQPQGNANNNNNNIGHIAQHIVQNPIFNPGQQAGQPQEASQFQGGTPFGAPMPSLPASNPADIQSDILRIQQNIVNSVRQLNAQHEQLEYVHALLTELNRLQQASGLAANGQDLPAIAPLNPNLGTWPTVPQAFFANGPVLRQGDTGLPAGVTLPEGWTLTPMALALAATTEGSQDVATVQPTPPTIPNSTGASTASESTQPRPLSSGAGPSSSTTAPPSTKPGEPSSLESSWSFGNVGPGNEAEGSSSAVAGSSSDGQNVTRRTATVEDAEDSGQ
ncbi:hypothetical protein BDV96DRAFT_562370 [Lophiotrema nucula]|uniref:RING-type E3 ubiquitin transferase n=1 Tax=Lophiotrema nucula TaxID=690887 RepID=A0A6A5ZSE8_9PLEO|nr:hypothetical protein BDV96DRAFT_562370 [Lophiotrema nucula]